MESGGNAWVCNSSLCWIKDAEELTWFRVTYLTCKIPIHLEGREWNSVTKAELGCCKNTTTILYIVVCQAQPALGFLPILVLVLDHILWVYG